MPVIFGFLSPDHKRSAQCRPSYGPRSDQTGSYLRSGFRSLTADSNQYFTRDNVPRANKFGQRARNSPIYEWIVKSSGIRFFRVPSIDDKRDGFKELTVNGTTADA